MRPLFDKCTPFSEPAHYIIGLQGFSIGNIKILSDSRAVLKNISWDSYTGAKIRVFQSDTDENEFYIAAHPIIKYSDRLQKRFIWNEGPQVFDNLPKELVTKKSINYIGPMLYEINTRRAQGILPASLASNLGIQDRKSRVVKSELYGPATRDEIISQMRMKFAYL